MHVFYFFNFQVMRTHGDFNNRNQPRNVTSTAPTFKVVREKSKRTVLVLDVSGSMKDNDRIGKLRQVISKSCKPLGNIPNVQM